MSDHTDAPHPRTDITHLYVFSGAGGRRSVGSDVSFTPVMTDAVHAAIEALAPWPALEGVRYA